MIENLDWIIVSNPESGDRKQRNTKQVVIEDLNSREISHVVVEERSRDKFRVAFSHLVQTHSPRRGVIVIGGDGTVHEVANIIHQVNPEIALAVIPAGTGNDFAINNGLGQKPVSRLLTTYHTVDPVWIDVIAVQDRICLQILSTGFDAQVSDRSRSLPVMLGNLRYIFGLLFELLRLRPIQYQLEIDGQALEYMALMISCANGKNYGGGMLLSPNSDHQDGILELIILHPVGRLELLKVFPKIYSGRHVMHPAFQVTPFHYLRLKAKTIAQGDGESVCENPLNLAVRVSKMRTWKI